MRSPLGEVDTGELGCPRKALFFTNKGYKSWHHGAMGFYPVHGDHAVMERTLCALSC